MNFNDYQQQAQLTDKIPSQESSSDVNASLVVPFLGLAGEAGELLSEYKKHLRDGDAHRLFKDRVEEELGDLLWYIANLATKFGLDLNQIAQTNLNKTQNRWGQGDTSTVAFDKDFPESERLPRKMQVEIKTISNGKNPKIRLMINGIETGDPLTDNSNDPDGYRFHDVFHLGYIAVLGWSPVIRKLMKLKRKSDSDKDEVDDGGRAQVIDEAVSALVFDYARNHQWLDGISTIDDELLKTIKGLTSFLEVKERSLAEWQNSILQGFQVWRQVKEHEGGRILVDQDTQKLTFMGPPSI
ncbi:nucleotide pyrophosphohydrolase [Delftia sp. HK171]|jgi:NTP pyrophosphatase (non-canonical NTP hydrolase)|uniref:nucleoside triphosphate pyrophosphohydrolase family protein n=1 Tax=Delftia sp. HK171 TaxID=1920191 RepID=UPI0009038916|nr:nucleoside triphosphate pyrophosphohydrolase family protein [Delftia sp. HK171]APE48287.1 nucleotide pyrophosphohydrolase [Delftia sp. HK171]